jgi:hypothetical protein
MPINMSSAQVGLNQEAESLLDWAREKKAEERKLKELMEQHPGLKDLHDKLEIMKILCYEEDKK